MLWPFIHFSEVVYWLPTFHMLLFSHPNSLQLHGLQQSRPPYPSPSPEVCPSSCPLHQWRHPVISSSETVFSFCLQSFPATGAFPMSQLFASDDQTTGPSMSVLPTSIQGWFPLRLTSLISLLSKGLQESSPAPQFKGINSLALCLIYGPVFKNILNHWKDHSLDYMVEKAMATHSSTLAWKILWMEEPGRLQSAE